MKTYVHSWYLAELFLDWEMFHTEFVERIKTRIINSLFSVNCSFYEIMWENILQAVRQAGHR